MHPTAGNGFSGSAASPENLHHRPHELLLSGHKASQLGADDVIKAEQAVALQFYEKLSSRIRTPVAEQV
jgi:hypothetical protein